MRKYFVSFCYKEGSKVSFGNTSINYNGIFSYDNISELERLIQNYLVETGIQPQRDSVVILNWKKYDSPE